MFPTRGSPRRPDLGHCCGCRLFQRNGGGLGTAQQIALEQVAPGIDQVRPLGFAFDPFGDNRQIERPAQLDDRVDQRNGVTPGAERRNERAVDLDLVDLEALQDAEAGKAGPEIIERDLEAHPLERGNIAGRYRIVAK